MKTIFQRKYWLLWGMVLLQSCINDDTMLCANEGKHSQPAHAQEPPMGGGDEQLPTISAPRLLQTLPANTPGPPTGGEDEKISTLSIPYAARPLQADASSLTLPDDKKHSRLERPAAEDKSFAAQPHWPQRLRHYYQTAYDTSTYQPALLKRLAEAAPDEGDVDEEREELSVDRLFEEQAFKQGGAYIRKKPKTVLLIGEPGVGKTTLCQRIAQQWAQGHAHSGFAAVYLLDAADLQDQKALATAIAQKYFATASTTAADLQQQVKQIRAQLTTGKSLIILDALEQTSGLGHPLVQEALQSRAHVLVTDHPWGAQDKYCKLLLNSDTLWLACQGLDQEQVNQYVYHQYLGDGKRAQALLAFLDNSPVAEDLHIPANLRLFFQCWRIGKDALKRLGKDSSKTMYYRTATELVRKKHMPTASDLNVMLGRAALSKRAVSKAYYQPVESSLETCMQQLGVENQADKKGLLNSLRESELLSPASPVDKRLTFRNPMLRAYLSGRELARQLLSVGERKVAQQWLQEHQYDPRHRATLTFMAGELGIQGHTAGVKIMLDALGTLAEQQVGDLPLLRLQLHCLSEAAESSKQVDVKLIEKTYKLQKKLLQWVGRALNKIEEDKYAEYGPLHEELLRFFPEIKHLLRDNRTCYELYTMVYYFLLQKEQEGTFVRGAARSFDNTLSASFEGLCEVVKAAPVHYADKAIPLLLEALQDTQPDMRFAALTTLRKILNALPDLYADRLLEGITKALGDTDQQLRILAVMTLADLGKINPDYTQKSLKALLNACSAYPWFDRSPDSDDMQQPTASAWKMPKPDARRKRRRRRSSAHSLPEMHRSALNILQAAASPKRSPKGKSPEGSVAQNSAKGSHWAVRSSGNIVLGKIGLQGGVSPPQSPLQVSQAMIALLSPQLEDRNRHVRQSALSALGGIFSQHPVLVSPILKSVDYALRDADKYVRRTAVELLGQIANIDGKQAVAMGDKLCAICKDEKEHEIVRLEAVKQLGKLTRPSAHHVREVLPVLLGLFMNDIFEEDEVKIISSTIEKIVTAVPTPHTLEVLTDQVALLSEGDKKEDKHEERAKAIENELVVIREAASLRDGAALHALYASNLGQLVGANPEFVPVIMRVLQQMASPSHPEPVAAAAVQALGQLALAEATYAPKVFDVYKHLLSRMDTIKKGKLLGAIIDALGTLQDVDKAKYDQEVIELIRQLLATLSSKQMTTTREVGYTMLKVLSKAAKGKQDNAQAHLSKLILSIFRQIVLAELPVSLCTLNKFLHTLNPTAASKLDTSKSSDPPYSLFGTNRNLGNTILSTHDGTLGIACQALVSVAQCSKTCADFALSVALCLTCTDYEYDTHQAGKRTLIQLLSINPSQIEGAINTLQIVYQDHRYTPASIRIAAMHTVVELLKTMPKMSSAEQCFTDQQLDKRSILEELLIAIVVDKSNEVHDATLPQLVNVASTRQLIEMYCGHERVWGPLFYTILNRLCQAPLLVSSHGDKYHFKAYDTQGVVETWEMPKRSAQRFVQAIRSKRPGGRKMCVIQ